MICFIGWVVQIIDLYDSTREEDFENLLQSVTPLMVLSDCSELAGIQLCQRGVVKTAVELLGQTEIIARMTESRFAALILSCSMCVCHNLAKIREFRYLFNESNAIDVLTNFLSEDSARMKLRMSALCTLSYILSDEDANKLSDNYNIIPALVNALRKALEASTKRYLGYSIEELVEALSNLAVNDENKVKLVDEKLLPLLVLTLELQEIEQERAISCLWQLSFREDVRLQIVEEPNCIELIRKISEDDQNGKEKLANKAKSALEFICKGTQGLGTDKVSSTETSADEGHIFISYNWKYQETVLKIRQLLIDNGYKVWIDVDQMHGSTLEAMARAVENASLVLICYSESYKMSNMCRTEAEYTFRLQKPFIPVNMEYRYQSDGWLGIIIGARLYVDFSLKKHPFDVVSGRLLREMDAKLKGSFETVEMMEKPVATPKKPSRKTAALTSTSTKSSFDNTTCSHCQELSSKVDQCLKMIETLTLAITNNGQGQQQQESETICLSWSETDVKQWLDTKVGLSPTLLTGFDGKSLCGLMTMKQSAPEIYYQSVLQLCANSLNDVTRFTVELEQLSSPPHQ